MRKIWKDLEVSESEKQLAEEIRNGGIGKTLTDEELNLFQVEKEWDLEIDTTVGKTLVHMYQDGTDDKKRPLFINIHGGGIVLIIASFFFSFFL